MDYGKILSKAWKIIWKHKILWPFGILAGCISQGGTIRGQVNSHFNGSTHHWPGAEHFFRHVPEWQIVLLFIGLALLIFVLVVLATIISSIGRLGLIKGTQIASAKGEEEKLSFSEVWQASLPFFWRMLGLNLLIVAFFATILGVIGFAVTIIAIMTLGIGMLCLMPLLCIFVPLAWVLGIIIKQANIALVVEDLGLADAIRRGWQVFRENLGEMIVMGLILSLGGGLVNLVIGAPLGIVLAPLINIILLKGAHAAMGEMFMAGLFLVGYLPILMVLNGILQTFIHSAWTLTYTDLSGYNVPAPPGDELPPAY